MADQIIHAFERAGLGIAPFRVMGVEQKRYCPVPGGPTFPGATCDYCGEAIVDCCIIADRHGKTFHVGNVCVEKTGDEGLINLTKKKLNAIKKQARWDSERKRIAECNERLKDETLRDKLNTMPHPYAESGEPFFVGKTRLDWALWLMSKAGNAGMMQVVRFVDKLMKGAA